MSMWMEHRRSANERGLRRLVGRVPRLRCHPLIAPLVSKGSSLEDEKILGVTTELILQPNLTVVMAGCFRHLSSHMVDYLVESMFPHKKNGKAKDFVTKQRSFSDLATHEYTVIALSRILELSPHVLSTVLYYFSSAPPPFHRLLLLKQSRDTFVEKDQPHLLDIVRASYRYILLESNSFRELWDWSLFIDLLQWADADSKDGCLSQITRDVRWSTVQILSLVLQMSDEATRMLSVKLCGLTEEMAFECLMRWEEFCQEVAIEKAGWYLEPSSEVGSNEQKFEDVMLKWKGWPGSLEGSFLEIYGIELPVRNSSSGSFPSLSKSLILTNTVRKNIEAIVLALNQKQPVLLEGPSGAGKTLLIKELAQLTGNSDVIFFHLDDQMDSKTLLGSYVCTEIPGEFRWQPGALTQAVVKGLWVVFEDIDRVPFEILSAMVPLLEDRNLYIPGRAETISAAENFQLFSTVPRNAFISSMSVSVRGILDSLWRKVVIDAPDVSELELILGTTFPSLATFIPKLLECLSRANALAAEPLSDCISTTVALPPLFQKYSVRDLMKWCKRIVESATCLSQGLIKGSSLKELIFTEAVDCFAASIAVEEHRFHVVKMLATFWGIPEEQVNYLEKLNKPDRQVISLATKTSICSDSTCISLTTYARFSASPSKGHMVLSGAVQIGRAVLQIHHHHHQQKKNLNEIGIFASYGHAMRMLERIAVCTRQQEPVLLVGETGTGKTTLVQYLANLLSMPLTVMNMSQQSDSSDLLGGFKPIEAQGICFPLLDRFRQLFCATFPSQQNMEYLARVQQFAEKKKWDQLLKAFDAAVIKVGKLTSTSLCLAGQWRGLLSETSDGTPDMERVSKRKRQLSRELLMEWQSFSTDLHKSQRQLEAARSSFAFSFVEGALVKSFRQGEWVLLDELNLAPPEVLERLTGILDEDHGTLSLTERGDVESIPRHPNFRIFACMNPATDVGKHDLPFSVKCRFTEIYVDEMTDRADLQNFVYRYLEGSMPSPPVDKIVNFYLEARKEADTRLFDGANQKPRYSLRTISRALEYTRAAMPTYGFHRALYDGIHMTFLTLLDRPSATVMQKLIASVLLDHSGPSFKLDQLSFKAPPQPSPNHVLFEQFWLECGGYKPSKSDEDFYKKYVLTSSISEHLKNLARAVFVRKYPVLLQGPTSSGKTSLVEYLAIISGHRFVRINNHEHTDLQEYLGTYVTDPTGKLVFQEGILVEAVRNGYWIVLDELNLAPSDVLEALNRLLDDNRELFIPETQTLVHPHSHFMLFATQNPPGVYGGRKVLSRAFRNRFLELHVDDIPEDEMVTILTKRCEIPPSYAEKMIAVMKDLQRHRQTTKAFAGKHGFITPRDLFRWGERHKRSGISYEDLAKDGYMLLAERLRDEDEKKVVAEVIERNLRVKLDVENLYEKASTTPESLEIRRRIMSSEAQDMFGKIVWTKSMRRLFSLVERCHEHGEPILLVGETGCGKTTVCQLLAYAQEKMLHILNCHQHTETSDFLGGFRPVREREKLVLQYVDSLEVLNNMECFTQIVKGNLSTRIEEAKETLEVIRNAVDAASKYCTAPTSVGTVAQDFNMKDVELRLIESIEQKLCKIYRDWQSLFVWQDGPLVEAMKKGHLFLVDEISLAEDSVLERLNSILEPKRMLVLAEKGGSHVEEIIADSAFLLMATMNPGGDFGKKELSPALRNRFTEIWVPSITDTTDLSTILLDRFWRPELGCLADPILKFWEWFRRKHFGRSLTLRDLLTWIFFINNVEERIGIYEALVHGAFLILLDGIGLGSGLPIHAVKELQVACFDFLLLQVPEEKRSDCGGLHKISSFAKVLDSSAERFGIHPFHIEKGTDPINGLKFELSAPTTCTNIFRILRAMQLNKPVLLEGSPGVGKTSLVTALANVSGHSLVRINLSEQTDMMDLLGSDLPVEGGNGAQFNWSDGIFLQALKAGSWVLLDELNLASQSVLEGLNSCLDHRGEVFIPELGCSFKCPPSFRIFACQNPSQQGGGRKCLPKSFLNRFTKVFVDALTEDDFLFIASSLHQSIPKPLLQRMIRFNAKLYEDTMVKHAYGHSGAPWEFNLRDILRSCTLLEGFNRSGEKEVNVSYFFLDVLYLQRMRKAEDRFHILKTFDEVFGVSPLVEACPRLSINSMFLKIGKACLRRDDGPLCAISRDELKLLPGQAKCLESMMTCLEYGWPCILVGSSASGKTSLIRLLAKLTGNRLHEFTLSGSTDTTELIGCFEQSDIFRAWQSIIREVHTILQLVCIAAVTGSMSVDPIDKTKAMVKQVMGGWSTFHNCLPARSRFSHDSRILLENGFDAGIFEPSILMLATILNQLEDMVAAFYTPNISLSMKVKKLSEELSKLKNNLGQNGNTGRFEWVDGGLLKAITQGDWVVLDNANLCNPTVLDRLNSLLEPDGKIVINERGLVDGQVMITQAHHKFRLFLTMDPTHGELSRAMRNRGVEIYVLQSDCLMETQLNQGFSLSEQNKYKHKSLHDTNFFLVYSGLPGFSLVDCINKIHIDVKSCVDSSRSGYCFSSRDLSQWVQLLQQLIDRGGSLSASLWRSWGQIYMQNIDSSDVKSLVVDIYNVQSSNNITIESGGTEHFTLQLPGGWPHPLKVSNLSRFSVESVVGRDCIYLQYIAMERVSLQLTLDWNFLSRSQSRRSDLISWLENNKPLAAAFPIHLLRYFLHPDNDKDLPESVKDESLELRISELDCMIFNAGFWMLEHCNFYDRKLRLLWLQHTAARFGAFCPPLNVLTSILKRELEHPMSLGLPSVSSEDEKRCEFMDVKSNESAKIMMPIGFVWGGLISRKLISLRRSLMQWVVEDDTLRKSENLSHSKNQPSILRSYGYHLDPSRQDGSLISDTWELFSYPLSLCLRNIEEVVFSSSSFSNSHITKLFSSIQEWHRAIWGEACRVKLEPASLNFIWKRTKQSVDVLFKALNGTEKEMQKVLDQFLNIRGRIDLHLAQCHGSSKLYVWKHCGHPLMALSERLFEKQQLIYRICQDDNMDSVRNCVVRRLMLEGVSIALCIVSGVKKLKRDEFCDKIIGFAEQEVDEIYKILEERIEKEQSRPIKDCAESAEEKIYDLHHLYQATSKGMQTKVTAWLRCKSLQHDAVLLARLAPVVVSNSATECPNETGIQQLRSLKELVLNTLDFQLSFSPRSPLDFVPQQQLLWTFDENEGKGFKAFGNALHSMWFNWHVSHWAGVEDCGLQGALSSYVSDATVGASRIFQALESVLLSKAIVEPVLLEDVSGKLAVLKFLGEQLWEAAKGHLNDVYEADLLRARASLQQLIFSHKPSMPEGSWMEIKCLFRYLDNLALEASMEQRVGSLVQLRRHLLCSNHNNFVLVVDSHIFPCLKLIYEESCAYTKSTDKLFLLGKFWFIFGSFHIKLLQSKDGLDPTTKFTIEFEYLSRKLASLKAELEVRQDCDIHTNGTLNMNEVEELLEEINITEQQLATVSLKIVYRPKPSRFPALCRDVAFFIDSYAKESDLEGWVNALQKWNCEEVNSQLPQQVIHWQENTLNFIHRFTSEYPHYQDFIQPIQLSIYELKYGMSLMFASSLQRDFARIAWLDSSDDLAVEVLKILLEFPSRCFLPISSIENLGQRDGYNITKVLSFICSLKALDQKVATRGDCDPLKRTTILKLRVGILRFLLSCIRKSVSEARVLGSYSFQVLQSVFKSVTDLWIEMQESFSSDQEDAMQGIQFKPRMLSLDHEDALYEKLFGEIVDDVPLNKDENEVQNEDKSAESVKDEDQLMKEAWILLQDQFARDVVGVHCQIFGLEDISFLNLQSKVGMPLIEENFPDEAIVSYDAGTLLAESIGHSVSASFDGYFYSSHLLRTFLEHEKLSAHAKQGKNDTTLFNIYKDANASETVFLLKPLFNLRKHVDKLLQEWPEQPMLQQLQSLIEYLFSIPVDKPLIKGLLGVEQLLAKARLWEENAPKYLSMAEELNVLLKLVSKWRKLELACWPTLFANVQHQLDTHVDKMWFSLHAVLYSSMENDCDAQLDITTASLEEFVQTATVGEFKRRLQLLLGFDWQLYLQMHSSDDTLPRSTITKMRNVVHNIHKYYSQFSPLIQDFIKSGKLPLEGELQDFIRLCKWDDENYYSLVSSTDRAHRKVYKIVHKYSDVLMTPVIDLLNRHKQSAAFLKDLTQQSERKVQLSEKDADKDNSWNSWSCYINQRLDELRNFLTQYQGVKRISQRTLPSVIPRFSHFLVDSVFSNLACERRYCGGEKLENLGEMVIVRSKELRENEKKRNLKKKALVDLLKELQEIGLSHHKSAVPKENRSSKSWFKHSPARVGVFLDFWIKKVSIQDEKSILLPKLRGCFDKWEGASDYYYKNLAVVQHLQENSLTFHKDLTLREVTLAKSYMEHFLYLQQLQRNACCKFAMNLAVINNLAEMLRQMGSEGADLELSGNEYIRAWMWNQKDILDRLSNAFSEVGIFSKKMNKICAGQFQMDTGKFISELYKIKSMVELCKKNLDSCLVTGANLFPTSRMESCWPVLITPQMEAIFIENMSIMENAKIAFEASFRSNEHNGKFIQCLSYIEELFCMSHEMSEAFSIEKMSRCRKEADQCENNGNLLEKFDFIISEFLLAVQGLFRIHQNLLSSCIDNGCADSLVQSDGGQVSMSTGNLQGWSSLLEEQMASLRLEKISQAIFTMISEAVHAHENKEQLKAMIACIHGLLESLYLAGTVILFDYISMHRSAAKLCYIISKLFNTLFSEGYCITKEDDGKEAGGETNETGTGMGEGAGDKDISDQLENEDQILGSEKDTTEATEKGVENNAKGVEMEQDFEAEMANISEDDVDNMDDEEESEDEQIESKMGKGSDEDKIVDEKLWGDEDKHDEIEDGREKYETGSGAQNGTADLELRAKDEDVDEGMDDKPENIDEKANDPSLGDQDTSEMEKGEEDDMNDENPFEKSDAYEEASGTKLDREEDDLNLPEDMDLENGESSEGEQEGENPPDENMEENLCDDGSDPSPASGDEGEAKQDEKEKDTMMEEDPNTSLVDDDKAQTEQSLPNQDYTSNQDSTLMTTAAHTSAGTGAGDSQGISIPLEKSADSENQEAHTEEMTGVPPTADNENEESQDRAGKQGGLFSESHAEAKEELHSLEKLDPNPNRSLGDVLKSWKERVRVSDTPLDTMQEVEDASNKPEGENVETGEEYQFTTSDENVDSQILAAATPEQFSQSQNIATMDKLNDEKTNPETILPTPIEETSFPTTSKSTEPERSVNNSLKDEMLESQEGMHSNEEKSADFDMFSLDQSTRQKGSSLENTVSLRRNTGDVPLTQESENAVQLWEEEEIQAVRNDLEIRLKERTSDMEKAKNIWYMFEQITTGPSQELAEQLRLIMEPTLAAKLEGDYRTGKRINMKKVIPYIASNFRKDKIWLRRTKPSKRQYQVVLAIDDSRSMAENRCGHMAFEALLTICKAMSNLEVGQMAVASFGEKGNVQLLHDFDQPFSSEVAIKMISQFTFAQENTIVDEPVVDLLRYLTRMLDTIAVRASIPTGRNHLQQLVLVIADGRFHEKETLRRCIREATSRRQLLAFIVLDNPQDSIMDVQSVSFANGAPSFSKYLDTFPFPYYVVLRNIEGLPRTLADLLRQWFELVQRDYS